MIPIALKRQRARQWNLDHKEHVKTRAMAYYVANKPIIQIKAKEYAKANRQELAKNQRRFRKLNPWYDSYQSAKQRCLNPHNPRYISYGAFGVEFHLTIEDTKSLWLRDKAKRMLQPSIDRIDTTGHYTLQNCRFIEKAENSRRMKRKRRSRLKMSRIRDHVRALRLARPKRPYSKPFLAIK